MLFIDFFAFPFLDFLPVFFFSLSPFKKVEVSHHFQVLAYIMTATWMLPSHRWAFEQLPELTSTSLDSGFARKAALT